MFTSLFLALVVAAIPTVVSTTVESTTVESAAVESDTVQPNPVPLKISLGHMTFQGDSINLRKSTDGAFECTIDGKATCTFGSDGDTDVAITAQNMVITSTAASVIAIRCVGDCKFTDSEHLCRADRMQIQLAKQFKLEMTGNSHVQYGEGDNRTSLAGESITFHDGTFRVSGAASVQRGQ